MPTLTLRLDDATAQALREQAESEHRSMNDVVLLAIRDRIATLAQREQRDSLIGSIIEENRDLLDRLSR